MNLESLKRWHWLLIGAIVGLAIAAVRTQTGASAAPDLRPGLAIFEFADLVAARTPDGRPVLRNLTLYPPQDGKVFVTGEALLHPNGPAPALPTDAAYRPFQLNTPVPFRLPMSPDAPSPTYTVRDYLADTNPAIPVRYAWYAAAPARFALWAAGSALVVGGLWPTLLRLLVGAGFGRPAAPEPEYDLSRFSGSAESPPPAPSSDLSPEDAARLEAVQQSLEAQLASADPARNEPIAPQPAPAIPQLSNAPLAPADAPEYSDDPKDYQGEFYPVARSAQKHDLPAD